MTAGLLKAYLDARYEVELAAGRVLLHVGQPAPALERALPAPCYALLTAWNPQSEPREDEANRAADADLQAELTALALTRLRAHGGDGVGHWHEPGWLVAGLEAAQADHLARRYGQAGILHWRHGEPVRLRMYGPRPPGDLPPHVDWPL
jgi:hypothetical protein